MFQAKRIVGDGIKKLLSAAGRRHKESIGANIVILPE